MKCVCVRVCIYVCMYVPQPFMEEIGDGGTVGGGGGREVVQAAVGGLDKGGE